LTAFNPKSVTAINYKIARQIWSLKPLLKTERQDRSIPGTRRDQPINTILASNTSSISIDTIAQHLEHPSRFVGMHFFNPAPVMKLVELVKGADTNEKVMVLLQAICQTMGKIAVVCKDAPGFIVNRVARHYYLESMWLLAQAQENWEELDPASLDKILEATGFKMGPFQLMDLIGMDINYGVSQIVYDALGQPERLKPSPIQAQKVADGHLGKKSGKGFMNISESEE